MVKQPAHALGDAAWGYSWDYAHDAVQANLVRRASAASTQRASDRAIGANLPSETPLTFGVGNSFRAADGTLRFIHTDGIEQLVGELYPEGKRLSGKAALTGFVGTFDETALVRYKVPAENIASAVALALVKAHAVATGRASGDEAVAPLAERLQAGLARDAHLARLSRLEKIALYQKLVATGFWLERSERVLLEASDRDELADLRAGAAGFFKTVAGIEPATVALTKNGLVPVRR